MYVNIIYLYIKKKKIVSTINTIDNVTIRNKCNFYNI